MKYTIDFEGLKKYLSELKESDFRDADGKRGTNPNGTIKRAFTVLEINYFKMDRTKITLDSVIDYGMPFLCDALGNDLSVIELSKRKHKLPTGRVIGAKLIETIITDCRKIYGTPLNGYWVIPPQYLTISC